MCNALHIHLRYRAAVRIAPAARFDRALSERQILVRHNEVGIGLHKYAESGAGRAGPEGVVEGEHTRLELFYTDPVLRTGIVERIELLLVVCHINKQNAVRKICSRFDRIGKSASYTVFYNQSVDHDFDIVFFILVEVDFFLEVIYYSVNAHADIAVFFCILELFYKLTFFAASYRSHYLYFCALGQL